MVVILKGGEVIGTVGEPPRRKLSEWRCPQCGKLLCKYYANHGTIEIEMICPRCKLKATFGLEHQENADGRE